MIYFVLSVLRKSWMYFSSWNSDIFWYTTEMLRFFLGPIPAETRVKKKKRTSISTSTHRKEGETLALRSFSRLFHSTFFYLRPQIRWAYMLYHGSSACFFLFKVHSLVGLLVSSVSNVPVIVQTRLYNVYFISCGDQCSTKEI